ncbi:hypothetical protein BCV70DRAFT_205887 [Testicularia cyperi]|uniref:BHLH domain-containing protein n=1 Tax=Testicularia cyperi TaxID=1882483 RepID=A0A317XRH6_9BASI|nr:hypothetical protein BCV70DRAFT_205887 [Testicularia cyperi]
MVAQRDSKKASASRASPPSSYAARIMDEERTMLPPITSLGPNEEQRRFEDSGRRLSPLPRGPTRQLGDTDTSLDEKARIRRPPSSNEMHSSGSLPPMHASAHREGGYASHDAMYPRTGDSAFHHLPPPRLEGGPGPAGSQSASYPRGSEHRRTPADGKWNRAPTDAADGQWHPTSHAQRGYPEQPGVRGEEASQPPWARYGDEHTDRRSEAYREDLVRRPGSAPRDRAGMQPDMYGRERVFVGGDRWVEERSRYPESYAPGPSASYPSRNPFPIEPRTMGRPLEPEADEEMRRMRRRGPFDRGYDGAPGPAYDAMPTEYAGPGPRSVSGGGPGMGSYSPPESSMYGPGAGRMMGPIEPPRPASAIGVMPAPGAGPHAATGPSSAGPGPGVGVGSGTSVPAATAAASGANTVNANRRVAHLLSEQKRRESINTGFEDLRQAIPACRDGQDSKATILRRALEYIRELESIVERQHRMTIEGRHMGFDTRSPPDDRDEYRRLGRPGDSGRRDYDVARRGTGGSAGGAEGGPRVVGMASNSFGMPRTGSPLGRDQHQPPPLARPSQRLPVSMEDDFRSDAMRAMPTSPPLSRPSSKEKMADSRDMFPRGPTDAKRWAEESYEDGRSKNRRRLSDGDQDSRSDSSLQSSAQSSSNYIAHSAGDADRRGFGMPHAIERQTSSPLTAPMETGKPRNWIEVNACQTRLENKSLVEPNVRKM